MRIAWSLLNLVLVIEGFARERADSVAARLHQSAEFPFPDGDIQRVSNFKAWPTEWRQSIPGNEFNFVCRRSSGVLSSRQERNRLLHTGPYGASSRSSRLMTAHWHAGIHTCPHRGKTLGNPVSAGKRFFSQNR